MATQLVRVVVGAVRARQVHRRLPGEGPGPDRGQGGRRDHRPARGAGGQRAGRGPHGRPRGQPGRGPQAIGVTPAAAGTEVTVGGRTLKLSNLDKVLWPETGFTKGQLIDYYARVADVMVPHLRGRPITLRRWPNGVDAASFYEKNCPSHRPPWVDAVAHGRRQLLPAQRARHPGLDRQPGRHRAAPQPGDRRRPGVAHGGGVRPRPRAAGRRPDLRPGGAAGAGGPRPPGAAGCGRRRRAARACSSTCPSTAGPPTPRPSRSPTPWPGCSSGTIRTWW